MLPFVGLMVEPAAEEAATGPSSDPSFASAYNYGGNLVGVQWQNGDETAYTQLGLSSDDSIEPSSVFATASPGDTNYETGTTTEEWWWVRHLKDGIAGDWVRAPFGE